MYTTNPVSHSFYDFFSMACFAAAVVFQEQRKTRPRFLANKMEETGSVTNLRSNFFFYF